MPSTQSLRRREQRRSLPKSILERNDAVIEHLGLAHHPAIHQSARYPGEQDDLVQEGRVGLINGVANFDPQRGFRISTYVLARVNGQILHFRRDRQHTLRIPWRLKDLHSRGMRLQAQRLQQRLEPLDVQCLAASLQVSPQRWREAVIAHSLGHVELLDVAPSMQGLGVEQRRSLINQIEDPSSMPASLDDPTLRWLQDALKTLEPQQRCWLLAHYVDNTPIKDLALREKVHPGLLRQSIRASLSTLRQEARPPTAQPPVSHQVLKEPRSASPRRRPKRFATR